MSRSPRIRAINVAKRIANPVADDFAVQQILELVNHDEKDQRGNRQLQGHRQCEKTMIVLLKRFPTIGTSPQRK
jgi:hypothetical protein